MLMKTVIIGVVVCLINMFLKKHFSEFVLPAEIVFLCIAVAGLVEYSTEIFSELSELTKEIEYSQEIFSSVVKGVGICLLTKFSSDICLENGNRLVADVIEFSGRIMLTVIAFPYIRSIIGIAAAFVK